MPKRLGLFVMVDGLDGVGKSVILDGLRDYVINLGKSVFDLENYWGKNDFHPEFSDCASRDVILSSEPTFVGVGKAIRRELIARHLDRGYSAEAVAQAYSLDRLILYKRVLLPALKFGRWVLQGRGVSSSIVYQPLQAQIIQKAELSLEYILNLEGNKLTLENSPDLLIVPTVKNVEELAKRLSARGKKDNAIFETTPFQKKLKDAYESAWFREIFESRGTVVKYLDAGISIEHSCHEAVRILEEFLKEKNLVK